MGNVVVLHLGLAVNLEYYGVGTLLLVGTKRTDEVAQTLRKHRYGAVDKIDARCAALCLLVDYASLGDIVRHVGNVDAHFPQVVTYLAD